MVFPSHLSQTSELEWISHTWVSGISSRVMQGIPDVGDRGFSLGKEVTFIYIILSSDMRDTVRMIVQ